MSLLREDGGTGRRVRLRGVWLHRAGSSPALRTNLKYQVERLGIFFMLIAGLSRSDAICICKCAIPSLCSLRTNNRTNLLNANTKQDLVFFLCSSRDCSALTRLTLWVAIAIPSLCSLRTNNRTNLLNAHTKQDLVFFYANSRVVLLWWIGVANLV